MSLTTENESATGSADTVTVKPVHALPSATIRFAGDSGDGMQLAGTQFTDTSALVGNDISTLPDFPAEIRALPARWRESADIRFTFPARKSSLPAIRWTRWWR